MFHYMYVWCKVLWNYIHWLNTYAKKCTQQGGGGEGGGGAASELLIKNGKSMLLAYSYRNTCFIPLCC